MSPVNLKLPTYYRMEHIFRVSEVLYVGLCCRLGTPTIVNLRREVMDMELMIQTTAMKRHGTMFTISGSYREGFRFKSSDQDTMVWNPSHKLIYEMSQFKDFDASGLDVILMEHSGTPPGFYWPQTALAWVARCQEKGWPVQSVLNEITSTGCHVIPIGSNVSCDEYALEWRLSFSQAEQILVYSMNHTQFLCYGVLKIFLKEVLSSTNQGSLICSYFLKTILFWEIQNDPDSLFWRPSNLLTCFWVCFKRLCKCVLDSNCPNFFIPENNMFRLKIVGSQQEALISQLNRYYEMGVACLFLGPTFMTILEPALSSPSFVIPSSEGDVMSLRGLDQNFRNELFKRQKVPQSKEDCFMILKSIPSLVQLRLSQFQSLALQHATANILVQLAFILADYPASHQNKTFYIQDRRIVNVLRLSSRFGPVSQLLYLGVYYYRTGRYNKVLSIAGICQKRFSQPFVLHFDNLMRQRYFESVGMHSLGQRMREGWMSYINFCNSITFLAELYFEQQEGTATVPIPPFVLIHMLCVLCHFRLGDMSNCLQSLTDLQTLLLYDDGMYVPFDIRDISWQILGICQHVAGDLQGALQSYRESLRQKPRHRIQRATGIRIGLVLQQLRERY
ncbi:uncharacterized protein LOC128165971 [Crassostrea angulata]|uniref:uncharacterized protein LOC128165971 n=1 Tax=Magallana angulata TaxID=2784310 RepID=UPI0022B0888E|nr:uncharacterized protein LOC128165971 [Crassostrea angulata]